MNHTRNRPDVVIVGSGPLGAVIARTLRDGDPECRILMIEGGEPLGSQPGGHLLDAPEPELRAVFERRARFALQAEYVRDSALENLAPLSTGGELAAGVIPAGLLGESTEEFPGASFAWNVGGMGVHWTAACPWIAGDELVEGISENEWQRHLEDAQRLLFVQGDPFPDSAVHSGILEALRREFPSPDPARAAQSMPMSGRHDARGRFIRSGPADIFPAMARGLDPNFELRTGTLCTGVVVDGSRVAGVQVTELHTGESSVIEAATVVIAADALRTPQLLWASGIRPRALGRNLNEHATLAGWTTIDPHVLGIAADDTPTPSAPEPYAGAYWLPTRGEEQPFHGQMMETISPEGEHRLGLSWYWSTAVREENRIEFSDSESDYFGLPAMTLHFSFSPDDLARQSAARVSQERAGAAIGRFDPSTSMLLDAGSSLHYSGTVRMGTTDDGTSVCDTESRVWGYDNLFVAGNGVIPTAISCNSTLTAVALAVRSVPAIAGSIRSREREAIS